MANPFYTYSGSIIAGMSARAEAVASEFQSVQAGFADLAISGTDSGSSAAYVVATPAGQPGNPLTDGDTVSFRASNTNSGSATLNVNSTGAVNILRFNGAALQPGDLTANSWYTLTYNSNYSAWTLPGATAITFSGSISGGAPVNKVGLVAAGGVSTSAIPIDATFAIDQTIAPTWTGQHTWNAANNAYGITINGGAATSQSFGMVINAGSNSSDIALDINSKAGANLVTVYGDGGVVVGTPSGGDRGGGTVNVSSGLFVNNVAVPTVGGTNTFSQNNTFSAGITVAGTATFGGPTTVSGLLTVSGTSSASGPWTFASNVTITGTASYSGPLTVSGTSSFSGPITISGTGSASAPWTFSSNVTVSGTSSISGPLTVSGTSTISGPLSISGTATFSNQVAFTHAISANSIVVTGPASGTGLYVNAATGTHSTVIEDSAGNAWNAGYLEIPQNTFGTSYASVLADSGKQQYHNSASAHTFTINDATVNYNKGASITIINENGGGNVTIALQTTPANLIWAPSATTGNRTLAGPGIATVTKVSAGTPGVWFITGVGLS